MKEVENKQKNNPDIIEFVRYYAKAYEERNQEKPILLIKELVIIKLLLKHYDISYLKTCLDIFMASEDGYRVDYSLVIFCDKMPELRLVAKISEN